VHCLFGAKDGTSRHSGARLNPECFHVVKRTVFMLRVGIPAKFLRRFFTSRMRGPLLLPGTDKTGDYDIRNMWKETACSSKSAGSGTEGRLQRWTQLKGMDDSQVDAFLFPVALLVCSGAPYLLSKSRANDSRIK
jgi:hypothetical protein